MSHSAEKDTPVLTLRVPTDRLIGNDGSRLNIGVQHIDVQVVLDPDLSTFGKHEALCGGDRITLREWSEQVLLHELLHVVVSRSRIKPTGDDPHLHDVIARVEVALWETGWRLTRDISNGASREHEHDVSCAFGNPQCPAFGEHAPPHSPWWRRALTRVLPPESPAP